MSDKELIKLLDAIDMRQILYYCNKCHYFGDAVEHPKCNYSACESSDSRNLTTLAAELRKRLSSNTARNWLDEANKVVGMFPDFGWPDRLSFSEAVAEQLVQMTRLSSDTSIPDVGEVEDYETKARALLEGYGFSSAPGLAVTDNLALAIATFARKSAREARLSAVEEAAKVAEKYAKANKSHAIIPMEIAQNIRALAPIPVDENLEDKNSG